MSWTAKVTILPALAIKAEGSMRYGVSGRASSIIAALLAVLLTVAMQLLSAERAAAHRPHDIAPEVTDQPLG